MYKSSQIEFLFTLNSSQKWPRLYDLNSQKKKCKTHFLFGGCFLPTSDLGRFNIKSGSSWTERIKTLMHFITELFRLYKAAKNIHSLENFCGYPYLYLDGQRLWKYFLGVDNDISKFKYVYDGHLPSDKRLISEFLWKLMDCQILLHFLST